MVPGATAVGGLSIVPGFTGSATFGGFTDFGSAFSAGSSLDCADSAAWRLTLDSAAAIAANIAIECLRIISLRPAHSGRVPIHQHRSCRFQLTKSIRETTNEKIRL